mmetsp:Transcript_22652/g.34489  ORF Transcript_22652/g.34489 Transcript_22652/m.34489 type:complete len:163 (+) Transcript_22652:3-491(+)|eukprot:CAMPEP_0117034912 /NCGR_PEP_ID=MMETSP0472-20121206/24825_1 /TAXON_ID=693140 ORGANISM="Tiarina fusus, Strain LIS" /NCGR_SAMPLE_ID=MMETSP0472 /ASSEMBLY_ACC=CAM_ASM_000603 /LENGTH=162 /DNA_ID=CAMNT_0004744221 /DNA_START=28 /DNA_END=516 /DNA_ORIENTATION=+
MTDSTAIFYGLMGAGSSLIFSCAGAAFGTAKSQQQCKIESKSLNGFTESNSPPPTITGKTLIPVIIAGVLAIYGLIYSIIVLGSVSDPNYSVSQGYAQFVGGLVVGLCCLGSGIAVGIVGKIGIRGMKENTSSFTMMVLNLIYCEALGLYGLIFALIAASTF